jgi:hypothetical protein
MPPESAGTARLQGDVGRGSGDAKQSSRERRRRRRAMVWPSQLA